MLIFSLRRDLELYRAAEARYLTDNHSTIYHYDDNTHIDAADRVDGSVVVTSGDLAIYGTVFGDVLVIDGDVRLYRDAYVTGNIVCVDGRIFQTGNSEITGYLLETSSRNLNRHIESKWQYYDQYRWPVSYWGNYSTLPLVPLTNRLLFRYNRVQGFFIGLDFPKTIGKIDRSTSLHGFAGYGFSAKKIRYQVGLDRSFFSHRDYRFELGGQFYDLTDTRDDWYITPLENTLAVCLIQFGLPGLLSA